MSVPEDAVRMTECPVCGDLILMVHVEGIRCRLAPWLVPASHALVLARYGVTVMRLVRTGRWAYVTEFDPTSNQPAVTSHVCGIGPSKF